MTVRVATTALAAMATSTATCMSIIGGWQRGDWLSERLVWVAIGVVLVAGAHLLPAFLRGRSRLLLCIGSVLWIACLAAACYGHATFFLFSMSHASDACAAALEQPGKQPALEPLPAQTGNIALARADAVAKLARIDAQRCRSQCQGLQARRVELSAMIAALDAQADDARHAQAWNDWHLELARRKQSREDTARDDPVTTPLSDWSGVNVKSIDLGVGLAFSLVLEALACLCWFIATAPGGRVHQAPKSSSSHSVQTEQPVDASQVSGLADLTPVEQAFDLAAQVSPTAESKVPDEDHEFAQLVAHISAGIVRPTVSGIRQYLQCSQAKASSLRRRFVALASSDATEPPPFS